MVLVQAVHTKNVEVAVVLDFARVVMDKVAIGKKLDIYQDTPNKYIQLVLFAEVINIVAFVEVMVIFIKINQLYKKTGFFITIVTFVSCGGNGSRSSSYQSTSNYSSNYSELSSVDNPCIECNSTGYVEDYSDNYYPCIKCGSRGVITSSSRSQPSFTGHLSYKKCKYTGYNRAAYGVCVCEHKYEEHCSPS